MGRVLGTHESFRNRYFWSCVEHLLEEEEIRGGRPIKGLSQGSSEKYTNLFWGNVSEKKKRSKSPIERISFTNWTGGANKENKDCKLLCLEE